MKILHTADIHIGAQFKKLGSRAGHKRKQLKATFRRTIDVALERKVDLVLIAGDLFDSNRVAADDVSFVREQLARLADAGVHVVMTAGTHDNLGDIPILTSSEFAHGLRDVHLLEKQRPYVVFEQLGVAVSGVSNYTKKSSDHPFAQLSPVPEAKVNIAMIHGSLQIPGKSAANDYPFTAAEIDASGFDYVALGHWHNFQEIPTTRVKAAYCGSSEPFDFNQTNSGHVVVVTIDESGVHVEPVNVSETVFTDLEIDMTDQDLTVVREQIRSIAGENVYARVTLRGLISGRVSIHPDRIEEEFADSFCYLRVFDTTSFLLSKEELARYPETMVLGSYVRQLQGDIATCEDQEERRVMEKALQYGVSLLSGKEDLL
jgi:DNA repair protein SbcD/Mre11